MCVNYHPTKSENISHLLLLIDSLSNVLIFLFHFLYLKWKVFVEFTKQANIKEKRTGFLCNFMCKFDYQIFILLFVSQGQGQIVLNLNLKHLNQEENGYI